MNEHNAMVERDELVRMEPRKIWWEVHLPTLILWYDRNTYHYSDFKVMLK